MLASSVALVAFVAAPSLASADVYVSPTGTDSGTCTSASPCLTISYAVGQASDPDTVNIAAGTYTGAANRGISFTKELTFQGAGKATTILNADEIDYLLWSQSDPITVRNLTVRNAFPNPSEGAAVAAVSVDRSTYYDVTAHDIEAIANTGQFRYGAALAGNDVTVTGSSTISGNTARYGGAIYANEDVVIDPGEGETATFDANYASEDGGAVYAEQTATVDNSTFTGRAAPNVSAGDDGGAIYVEDDTPAEFDLVVTDSTFTGFVIEGYYGGALITYYGGTSLDNVTVSDSFSEEYGGGLYSEEAAEIIDSTFEGNDTGSYEGGGAHIAADVLIERSTFRNNKADDGGDDGAGFYADPDTSAIIRDSLFEGNEARTGGGAYLDVSDGAVFEVSDTTFRNNTANASGGAAYFGGRGIAQVSDSTFEDNSAVDDGGALELNSGTITGSTFTGNSNSAGAGSAVFMSYGPENVIENSTFTGNSGYNVIFTDNSEDPAITLEVNNVTLAGNTLDDLDYPAIDVLDGATANLEVSNSIIAQDDGPGVDAPGCDPNDRISSGGGNVIQDTTTGCDDLIGGPPAPTTRVSAAQIGLEALALNAPGTTETMAIGADSVASKAGVLASCLPTDQRGVSRPADSCSSGAYQYTDSPSPTAPSLKASVGTAKKVRAGKTAKVGLRVTNRATSQSAAESLRSCLTLPRTLLFVSAGKGKVNGRTACWNRSSLAIGSSVTFKARVRALKSAASTRASATLRATVTASGQSGGSASVSGRTAIRILPARVPRPQPPTG